MKPGIGHEALGTAMFQLSFMPVIVRRMLLLILCAVINHGVTLHMLRTHSCITNQIDKLLHRYLSDIHINICHEQMQI